MSDDDLEKIRQKKAEMLMKFQSFPRNIINIHTVDQFNKLISDYPDKIFIIDFWAVWCAPCKIFAPTFERLQQEYTMDFIFIKINVDNLQEIAGHYGITSIPTTLFIKNGQSLYKVVGAQSYNDMNQVLEKLKDKFY